MALMMKICGLSERNIGADERYRYLSGWIDGSTKLVIMPNRDREEEPEAEWIAYIAAYPEERTVSENEEPDALPAAGD
jgi:hypothetical protein